MLFVLWLVGSGWGLDLYFCILGRLFPPRLLLLFFLVFGDSVPGRRSSKAEGGASPESTLSSRAADAIYLGEFVAWAGCHSLNNVVGSRYVAGGFIKPVGFLPSR